MLTEQLPFAPAQLRQSLVDAPCSGTGTLRRNPEIRWRLSAGRLRTARGATKADPEKAVEMVKPGGRLIYSTCSVEHDENEQVIQDVLASDDRFRPLNTIRTWPHREGCDGFFIAFSSADFADQRRSAQRSFEELRAPIATALPLIIAGARLRNLVSLFARITSVFRSIAIVIAIAAVFLFGVATTVYLSLRSPEVKVPDVVGKDRFEAERILAEADLKFRVRATRPSNEAKPDTVVFQLPRAGEVVKAGQTVAMDISRPTKGRRVT